MVTIRRAVPALAVVLLGASVAMAQGFPLPRAEVEKGKVVGEVDGFYVSETFGDDTGDDTSTGFGGDVAATYGVTDQIGVTLSFAYAGLTNDADVTAWGIHAAGQYEVVEPTAGKVSVAVFVFGGFRNQDVDNSVVAPPIDDSESVFAFGGGGQVGLRAGDKIRIQASVQYDYTAWDDTTRGDPVSFIGLGLKGLYDINAQWAAKVLFVYNYGLDQDIVSSLWFAGLGVQGTLN